MKKPVEIKPKNGDFWSILTNFFEFFDHLVRKIEKLVFFYVLSVPNLPGKKCYLLFISSPKGRFNFNGFFHVLDHWRRSLGYPGISQKIIFLGKFLKFRKKNFSKKKFFFAFLDFSSCLPIERCT